MGLCSRYRVPDRRFGGIGIGYYRLAFVGWYVCRMVAGSYLVGGCGVQRDSLYRAIPAYLPDDTHYSIVYKIADQIGASGVDGFCMRRLLWGIQAIALCQHDCQCVVVDCPPCVVVARCVVREVCFIPSYTRFVPLAARCGMAVRTVGGNRMVGI